MVLFGASHCCALIYSTLKHFDIRRKIEGVQKSDHIFSILMHLKTEVVPDLMIFRTQLENVGITSGEIPQCDSPLRNSSHFLKTGDGPPGRLITFGQLLGEDGHI